VIAKIESDPAFLKAQAERDQRHSESVARLASIMEPVLADLEAMGLETAGDLYAMVRRHAPLPAPVVARLLTWLDRITADDAREGIVRALAASRVPFDGAPLVRAFESSDNELFRWAVANTFASANTTGVDEWLVRTLRDPASGIAREMLATAVARHAPPDVANAALVDLFDELPGHAAMGLAISGGVEELLFLRNHLNRGKSWEQKEVRKAIRVLERRLGKRSEDA
jgi:hypothetical protein